MLVLKGENSRNSAKMKTFLCIIIHVLLGTQTSEAACPEEIPELTKWSESTAVIVIINLINAHTKSINTKHTRVSQITRQTPKQ